jgi:hypothetical protein
MQLYKNKILFIARLLLSSLLITNCGSHKNVMIDNEQYQSEDLPPTIDLASLGSQGFVITSNDIVPVESRVLGDVNGDGFDDVIIGLSKSTNNDYIGAVNILYGNPSFPSTINLSSLGSRGITINNPTSSYSVSGVGDINGDGFDDIIIGGYNHVNNYIGPNYIVYGGRRLNSTINLPPLENQGVTIKGNVKNAFRMGRSVSGAGDVNGDGFDDVIIGAHGVNNGAGVSYIIYGNQTLPPTIDVSTLGNAGVTIHGSCLDFSGSMMLERNTQYSGYSVSTAGDVNGDGLDDVIIGAPEAASRSGYSYIVYGSKILPSTICLSDLGKKQGVTIINRRFISTKASNPGSTKEYFLGESVSEAGDINGDGFGDVIIGAPGANGGAGVSYIIYGKQTLSSIIDVSSVLNKRVVIIEHDNGSINGAIGKSVSSACDINADGLDDIIIGTSSRKHNADTSYIVYGSHDLPSAINLSSLGSQGITINGNVHSYMTMVSKAGDVNGDGAGDIIIGAPRSMGEDESASYVIYGRVPPPSVSTNPKISVNNSSLMRTLFTSFSMWWYGNKLESLNQTDNIHFRQMLKLKNKCQRMIEQASNVTEDKWYAYSLEDMLENINKVLKSDQQVDKYTVHNFKKRLISIKKDFLYTPTQSLTNASFISSYHIDQRQSELLFGNFSSLPYQPNTSLALP